jgi:hypothetical protein
MLIVCMPHFFTHHLSLTPHPYTLTLSRSHSRSCITLSLHSRSRSHSRSHTLTPSTLSLAAFLRFTLFELFLICHHLLMQHRDGKLAYKLILPPTAPKTKIKDIIGCPNEANDPTAPNFLIGLTADNHLAFFDLDSGVLVKYAQLASLHEYKFKYHYPSHPLLPLSLPPLPSSLPLFLSSSPFFFLPQ